MKRELAVARTRESLDVHVQKASQEILASPDRLQEVLEKGSVAEVKAILRAYIGRVEYDPEKNRARIGFLRMPNRARMSDLAAKSARISMVAGARYEGEKKILSATCVTAFRFTAYDLRACGRTSVRVGRRQVAA